MSEYGVKVGGYVCENHQVQVVKVTKKMCTIIRGQYCNEEKIRIKSNELVGPFICIPRGCRDDPYGYNPYLFKFEKAKYYTPEQYEDHYHVDDEVILLKQK